MIRFANQFNPKELDVAGRVLVDVPAPGEDDTEWSEAFELVSQWRVTHAGPLKAFRNNLGRRVGDEGIVAQRLKRMPTIISKLGRLPWLKLSRMQDIGGCRAIVGSADDPVGSAGDALDLASDYVGSSIRHELTTHKNYIDDPRASGYRGLHLVYSYNSDRSTKWHGLKTEIQIRTQFQHQWATAVETVGTFTRNELKSSLGNQGWLRFFALISSVIARLENTQPVPNTPSEFNDLLEEIRECDKSLGISERLAAFQSLTSELENLRGINNHWVGLELDLDALEVTAEAFRSNDAAEEQRANEWYSAKEKAHRNNPRLEVVMVSVRSIRELRRAYPNYFSDLTEFRALVKAIID